MGLLIQGGKTYAVNLKRILSHGVCCDEKSEINFACRHNVPRRLSQKLLKVFIVPLKTRNRPELIQLLGSHQMKTLEHF